MTLTIENIGKLTEANIELNGITVIAGENNSGKSTIGKVLFSVVNGFCDIEKRIKEERIWDISRTLEEMLKNYDTLLPVKYANESADSASIHIEENYATTDLNKNLREYLINYFSLSEQVNGQYAFATLYIDAAVEKIQKTFEIADTDIISHIFKRSLDNEFGGEILNKHAGKNPASIKFQHGDNVVKVQIANIITTSKIAFSFNKLDYVYINKEAVYIDNPYTLDSVFLRNYQKNSSVSFSRQALSRQTHLFRCIDDTMESNEGAISSILKEKQLNQVIEKISTVCNGKLIADTAFGRREYSYSEGDYGISFKMDNVSTGLKTFVIIKAILQNGGLKEGGILILDEPEIHLHPEWQIVLAELIVLIQKDFGITVLITTHSPYFLDAIEVFSKKYEINEKCKFYQAKINGNTSTIVDATDDIESIYKTMARPLQTLENERYAND